ncbi:myelin-associated glycoprotein-like [Denticeps clupeoides]|uniref:myelin-associated glycoprotein-like n=1 Tax=Denticeps clupeoides TaxID=299321 RepID=UPI0010A50ACC|nr:myelin-associated glycoprotein-like [Denticeps clupeoides]
MPPDLETFEGSCVLIPCSFSIPAKYESSLMKDPTAEWKKGSRFSTHATHSKILGQLTQKNCTSLLYNITKDQEDVYFFRVKTGLQHSFDEKVNITTRDVLPKPRVAPPSRQQEGSTIRVACSVASPCPQSPPTLTWRPALGDSVVTMQKKEDGTQEVSSVLSFISSSVHNGVDLSCVVSSSETRAAVQETIRLAVDYCPKNVSVSVTPAEWLLGSDVTLSCFSDAHPAVESYWWFWENGNHPELVGQAADLSLNLTLRTMGRYWCRVQNRLGEASSTVVELRIPGSDFLRWMLAGGLSLLLASSLGGCMIYWCRRANRHRRTMTTRAFNENLLEIRTQDAVYANVPKNHKLKKGCNQKSESSYDENVYANY